MPDKQLRAMIDTSAYQFLLEGEVDKIEKLVEEGKIIVYGCKVVRDELRKIPRNYKYKGKSLRILLLNTYDNLVGKRAYPVGVEIEALAKEYLDAYEGNISRTELSNDFKIVATATIHRLDVIVSEDKNTMKSNNAMNAYKKINERKMYPTPRFLGIKEV